MGLVVKHIHAFVVDETVAMIARTNKMLKADEEKNMKKRWRGIRSRKRQRSKKVK